MKKYLFSKMKKKTKNHLVRRLALFHIFVNLKDSWILLSTSAFNLMHSVLGEVQGENPALHTCSWKMRGTCGPLGSILGAPTDTLAIF